MIRVRETVGIEKLAAAAYKIPTDSDESDGTFEWDSTTIVIVEAKADGKTGLGYTYADTATATLINDYLSGVVIGCDPMAVQESWEAMVHSIRNLGRPGISSMAIAGIDIALWDLKARLLDQPLVNLFGKARDSIAIYGSGGFTSYTVEQLCHQLRGWSEQGIQKVKMKIGRDAAADVGRVRAARKAIGDDVDLFVDANGAYTREQSIDQAKQFAEYKVSWFEEPVSSDDLEGLAFIRKRAPRGMKIAAGEYGYDQIYFERMLDAGAVDVLQADVTRCAGFTGFLQAAELSAARNIPLSSHCAPALHLHVDCAAETFVHAEYFHDHIRIEEKFFEGNPEPIEGALHLDLSRPGNGLQLKSKDVEQYRII